MIIMKLMFASDIHGSGYYAQKIADNFSKEKAEKLILLGDLLYHGPRNPLPYGHDPKEVTCILNGMKKDILCVRGNCDSEVDQMVLEFPIMADYMIMYIDGKMVFVTHGHLFNEENMPMMNKGDILVHGHTHLKITKKTEDYYYFNPGSAALPKDDEVPSYMVYEDGIFSIKDMDGGVIKEMSIK